jgi:DNA gyrase subunit A
VIVFDTHETEKVVSVERITDEGEDDGAADGEGGEAETGK